MGDPIGGGETPGASGIRSPPRMDGTLIDINEVPSDVVEPQNYFTGDDRQDITANNLTEAQDQGSNKGDKDIVALVPWQAPAIKYPIPSITEDIIEMLSGPEVTHIHMWKDGFSINDGPLEFYDDPKNSSFMKYINKAKFDKVHLEVMEHSGNYLAVSTNTADTATASQIETSVNQERDTISINESTLRYLLDHKHWHSAESSISAILGGPYPSKVHPVVYLELRRRALMDLLDKQDITGATDYYKKHILPFKELLQLDQGKVQFASHDYLRDKLGSCEHALDTQQSNEDDHDDNGLLTKFIFGYIQLHTPGKLGLKTEKGLWRLAKEIPKQKPTASKKSFRCLACSNKDFHNCSIGKLLDHLYECNPWMGSPFLSGLLDDIIKCEAEKAAEKAAEKLGSEASQDVLSKNDCHELMMKELGEIKAYDLITRQYIPEEHHGFLDRKMDSLRSLMSTALSIPGPSSPVAGCSTSSTTKKALKPKAVEFKAKASVSRANPSVSKSKSSSSRTNPSVSKTKGSVSKTKESSPSLSEMIKNANLVVRAMTKGCGPSLSVSGMSRGSKVPKQVVTNTSGSSSRSVTPTSSTPSAPVITAARSPVDATITSSASEARSVTATSATPSAPATTAARAPLDPTVTSSASEETSVGLPSCHVPDREE